MTPAQVVFGSIAAILTLYYLPALLAPGYRVTFVAVVLWVASIAAAVVSFVGLH